MMGKFSKVAQGVMMVHSKGSSVDFGFLAEVARRVGCQQNELVSEIANANTASQVGDMMAEENNFEFFNRLCEACCHSCVKGSQGWNRNRNSDLFVERTII